MKRTQLPLIAALFVFVACQSQSLTTPPPSNSQQIPAVAVNDPCSSHTTEADCKGSLSLCAWTPVAACPAGATCPAGVCVSPDPCAGLTTAAACQADANCAWSTISGTTAAPALCPVGQDCGGGGFCFERPVAGPSCLCVQPLACPANGACPPVQCDCPPPPPVDAGSSGGGTCTCGCPACLPGEACPPCDCTCGSGGGTGGTGGAGGGCGTGAGGSTGAGGGTGTCTCNCPECPAGEACPACSCSCSNGATTTMTVPTSGGGTATPGTTTNVGSQPAVICTCPACPANAACAPCDCATPPPADPCTSYTDAKSCVADTADACGWTALAIECLTTPCPTGSCARMQPVVTVDGGSGSGVGGCGCACPACPAGATCPACTCNCCGGQPPPPVGVTPQVTGDAGTSPPSSTPILL